MGEPFFDIFLCEKLQSWNEQWINMAQRTQGGRLSLGPLWCCMWRLGKRTGTPCNSDFAPSFPVGNGMSRAPPQQTPHRRHRLEAPRYNYCHELPPPARQKGYHYVKTYRMVKNLTSWAELWQGLREPMLFRSLDETRSDKGIYMRS